MRLTLTYDGTAESARVVSDSGEIVENVRSFCLYRLKPLGENVLVIECFNPSKCGEVRRSAEQPAVVPMQTAESLASAIATRLEALSIVSSANRESVRFHVREMLTGKLGPQP